MAVLSSLEGSSVGALAREDECFGRWVVPGAGEPQGDNWNRTVQYGGDCPSTFSAY